MLEPVLCPSCNGQGRVNAAGEACHPDSALTTCPTCQGASKTGFLDGKERLQNAIVAAAERLAGDPEQAALVSKLTTMANELSGYVLAPAPTNKVAYAGGEVCGVLVRDPSGQRSGVMAVTDAGRTTRLDDRITGPADAELRRSFGERVEPVSVHQAPEFGEMPPSSDQIETNTTVAWAWINRGRAVTVDEALARELIADGETVRPLTYADTPRRHD